jgi:Ca2+-dependent lipid-binding protein
MTTNLAEIHLYIHHFPRIETNKLAKGVAEKEELRTGLLVI